MPARSSDKLFANMIMSDLSPGITTMSSRNTVSEVALGIEATGGFIKGRMAEQPCLYGGGLGGLTAWNIVNKTVFII